MRVAVLQRSVVSYLSLVFRESSASDVKCGAILQSISWEQTLPPLTLVNHSKYAGGTIIKLDKANGKEE